MGALGHRGREWADRLVVFYLSARLHPRDISPVVCDMYISHMLQHNNFTYCQGETILKEKKKKLKGGRKNAVIKMM